MGRPTRMRQVVISSTAVLALVLAGCTSSSEETASVEETAATEDTATVEEEVTAEETPEATAGSFEDFLGNPSADQCAGDTYDLGFDVFSDNESFALKVREGIDRVAAEMGCVTVTALSDNADPVKAVENVKIFLQQGKDGVMLAQVIAAAQPGIVAELEAAGVPGVATFVPAPGIPFVDQDNFRSGEKAGEALGQAGKAAWGDEVPYLLIGSFQEGGELSIARMDGYLPGVQKEYPDLPESNIFDVPTAADPAQANTNTANVLSTIPEGSKILLGGINDDNTLAMVQAIKNANKNYEFIAIGQGASVLDSICTGDLYGSVAYFPENYGAYLIPSVIGMIQGQAVPEFVELPTVVLTKDNLGEYYPESACS